MPARGRSYHEPVHWHDRQEAPIRALDPLVFSSLWAAAVAPCLMYAAATAGGFSVSAAAAFVGFTGTLVVYGVDRLRDLARDQGPHPARSAFVAQHARGLGGLYAAAAVAGGLALLRLPAVGWLAVALAGGLGLFHRRLKGGPPWRERGYVALAWVAVCVGLPAATTGANLGAATPAGVVLLLVLSSNLVACSADPHQPLPPAAVGLCGGALTACLLPGAQTLWPLALCELLALLQIGRGVVDLERYRLIVLDGALAAGAGIAVWVGT